MDRKRLMIVCSRSLRLFFSLCGLLSWAPEASWTCKLGWYDGARQDIVCLSGGWTTTVDRFGHGSPRDPSGCSLPLACRRLFSDWRAAGRRRGRVCWEDSLGWLLDRDHGRYRSARHGHRQKQTNWMTLQCHRQSRRKATGICATTTVIRQIGKLVGPGLSSGCSLHDSSTLITLQPSSDWTWNRAEWLGSETSLTG